MNLYFDEKYGKLYETHEDATLETFFFENKYGKMKNMFLKREIPYKIEDQTYYDIFTPYGYGGPLILSSTNKDKLVRDYLEAFSTYCFEKNIISEFVRFHPVENQDVRLRFGESVEWVGKQVIRNLKDSIESNMSKKHLKGYKRNISKGMEVVFDETGSYLSDYLDIYYSTMNRNHAAEYYFFDRSFFENIQDKLKGHYFYVHIFFEGIIISSGIVLYDDMYSYALLGGTREGFYKSSPLTNVEIETMKKLKEKGVSYYLMGGGHNGEDGIYQFKKRFAKNSDYDYYVSKKIHQNDVYEKLVQKRFHVNSDRLNTSFFPAYRADVACVEDLILSNTKNQ